MFRSFQSLNEIKTYIESRTPVTLQHPHHITVIFSSAAPRAAWQATERLTIYTLNFILSPRSYAMLLREHRYSLIHLLGASTLFKLRGLNHA